MYSTTQQAAAPPAQLQQQQQQPRSVAAETFLLDQEAQQSLPADSVVALQQVDNLKYFLISAPVDWAQDQYIRRFLLPTGEYVSCVLWNNLFHISGTDIVRCLAFRFQAFGRPVKNPKKFEEGVFSDLRNLKSGTDATLEEPKSAFLDFLYKNNCIRTQKKQKVFYWYSVSHDRLFLDALERDLKREKAGQEATTVAVSEPALSFEFDSSQSLFEQLTRAQQDSQAVIPVQPPADPSSRPGSPSGRAADSMPPPAIIPNQQNTVSQPMSQHISSQSMPSVMQDDPLTHAPTYSQMGIPPMPLQIQKTRERSMGPVFDRTGVPLSQITNRHSSMPAYMEYSPAPSFVSSHFDDYSQRALSFEPMTPPQHSFTSGTGAEPAYIANEDTGLYSAIPDVGMHQPFNPLGSMPSSLHSGSYAAMGRMFPSQNPFPPLDGSPTYKQRRRQPSLTAGGAIGGIASVGPMTAHAVHRPSDLRRSMSASVMPQAIPETHELNYHDTSASLHSTHQSTPAMGEHKDLLAMSRYSTPLRTMEAASDDSPHAQAYRMGMGMGMGHRDDAVPYLGSAPHNPHRSHIPSTGTTPLHHHAIHRTAHQGVYRRARSATLSEMSPYAQKSHSCPIPMCGRLFKRLEHLKRHVRTHTQERPYICNVCNKAFSRSDNLAQHRRTHDTGSDIMGAGPVSEEDGEGEMIDMMDDDTVDALGVGTMVGNGSFDDGLDQVLPDPVHAVHDISSHVDISGLTPSGVQGNLITAGDHD